MKDKITGYGNEVPPQFKFVEMYFLAAGKLKSDAEAFYWFYEQRNWQYRGKPIRNWKELAWNWIYIKSSATF
ncbi:MAG: hypothetical protein ACN6O7_00265 [Sphingobacterium sp.]